MHDVQKTRVALEKANLAANCALNAIEVTIGTFLASNATGLANDSVL